MKAALRRCLFFDFARCRLAARVFDGFDRVILIFERYLYHVLPARHPASFCAETPEDRD